MNVQHAAATVSLELRGGPGLTVNSAPQGVRTWMFAGAAFVSGLVYLLRKGYSDGVRRRVIRRLDIIAPRTRFNAHKLQEGKIFNADCPVCLCDFAKWGDKVIRILDCGHALCADCLEAWAVHCTKAHLNPSRFGITRGGRVVAWTPGPKCPLCCGQLNCVPKEDLREAVIAAISQRGAALSTYIAYQNRVASDSSLVSPFGFGAAGAGVEAEAEAEAEAVRSASAQGLSERDEVREQGHESPLQADRTGQVDRQDQVWFGGGGADTSASTW